MLVPQVGAGGTETYISVFCFEATLFGVARTASRVNPRPSRWMSMAYWIPGVCFAPSLSSCCPSIEGSLSLFSSRGGKNSWAMGRNLRWGVEYRRPGSNSRKHLRDVSASWFPKNSPWSQGVTAAVDPPVAPPGVGFVLAWCHLLGRA